MPDAPNQSRADVPFDVLRIAAEHGNQLAEILRAVRLDQRAELLDDFVEALHDASEGQPVDWDELLADLHAREMATRATGAADS